MPFLLEQCYIAFEHHSNIMLTLFLAGLVGGLTHCSGMCGPFVLAQVRHQSEEISTLQKISGSALFPYHLGRMTTYMILGAIAALLSKQIIGTPFQNSVSALFLSLAGFIFITSALPSVKQKIRIFRSQNIARAGHIISKIAKPLLNNPKTLKGYGLGVLLGLLPCGLIFASLMIVATTGSPFIAAIAMAMFTLGTFPALFIVGIGSSIACQKWPNTIRTVAKATMVLNGCSLFILAAHMIS